MPANAHTAVYSCLWMFPGWLGSDKSSTSNRHKRFWQESNRKWSFQTLCEDSTYLYTHLAAPHHYDARHFKNAYPVTGNGIHLPNTMMSLWRLTEHQHKPGISKHKGMLAAIHHPSQCCEPLPPIGSHEFPATIGSNPKTMLASLSLMSKA